MAVYPEGNPGVYPLDPATLVGQTRVLFGDVYSTPYDPVEAGYQNYAELSDAEIEAYLATGGGVPARAIGYYYLSLSGTAAKESKSVKDQDLQVDLTKRAADLRAQAKYWFDLADAADGEAGGADFFDVFPTTDSGAFIAEGTPPIYGRQYTIGRWR
jgi:hypothetical protein